MKTIARLNSLDDAYRGMEILRQNAIPPALHQDGELLAIRVDDDFVQHAQQLFQYHKISTLDEVAMGGDQIVGMYTLEDDNT